ncbi:MAG: VIT1/CCC1 transporter family protein [Saprospiraceae bacterium]|nr:VIT1/CCC1 transporter family protein [Saprospiraceae bacterium]
MSEIHNHTVADAHLHHEKHFQSSDALQNIVIGMSDGLTVPFALAAGLSGAVNDTHTILTAGIAEIIAGSIAMGLGGFLSGKATNTESLKWLCGLTLVALLIFGYFKSHIIGQSPWKGATQTAFIGALAAAAAFGIARLLS